MGHPTTTTQDDHYAVHGVKDQIHAHITSCLRGASAVFLHTIEEESGSDEDALAPSRRKAKCTSGKLQPADNTVVNQITWPHEVYTHAQVNQPHMRTWIAWVLSMYILTVMAMEPDHIKAKMLIHQQELIEDSVAYGWQAVHLYHAAWLQHLEQG